MLPGTPCLPISVLANMTYLNDTMGCADESLSVNQSGVLYGHHDTIDSYGKCAVSPVKMGLEEQQQLKHSLKFGALTLPYHVWYQSNGCKAVLLRAGLKALSSGRRARRV